MLITPKKSGAAQVILWDDNEKSQTIDVVVQADVGALAEQLKTLFPEVQIRTSAANGNIVLRGRVPNAELAEQAVQVATPYGSKILNLLEVAGGQQVMLQVRFAEVSRSATSALGVNLFAANGVVPRRQQHRPGEPGDIAAQGCDSRRTRRRSTV